jgi:endonuclease/exonuclease/phosphatase family metal-dependent hydrolase
MSTDPDPATTPWRLLTWNLHGSAGPDIVAIASVIREYDPDVVLLQELRTGQARRLAAELEWQHRWARKHYPYTPLLWWTAEGLAVMSRHDLSDPVRRSISPGVSTWTHRHRIVLAVTARRADGDLRVYDTHLASHSAADERIAQARRVAGLIREEGRPLVAAGGDLNAPGEVEVIREFHPVGLRDPGGGPTNPATAPRQRLDYILVPEQSRVLEQQEPSGGERWAALSDHLPVLVEFAT